MNRSVRATHRRGAVSFEAIIAFPVVALVLSACLQLGIWTISYQSGDRAAVAAASLLGDLDAGNSPSGKEVDGIAEAFRRAAGLASDGSWAIRLRRCRVDSGVSGGAKCGWTAKRDGDGSVSPPPSMASKRLADCTTCDDGTQFAVIEARIKLDPSGIVPSPADRIDTRHIEPIRDQSG